ncbi:hypothetical protein [Actinacidiphila yeochonensis]|uniref:hypothetical protein n=1 Tax=Actinacidiphila yeochonensis TaxID=89050 RepID=UPI000A5D3FB2|nr:hypothetical protein [Actinacidiphila yeochonensis]
MGSGFPGLGLRRAPERRPRAAHAFAAAVAAGFRDAAAHHLTSVDTAAPDLPRPGPLP